MNILPKFALCNNGCTDRSAADGSTAMRVVRSFLCSDSESATAASAVWSVLDLSRVLRSVAAAVGLGLMAAVLTSALLSEDYARGVQMQVSGYSALADMVAGNGAEPGAVNVAGTARSPALPKQTGL